MSKMRDRYEMFVCGEDIHGLTMKISKGEFERQLKHFKEEVAKYQKDYNGQDNDYGDEDLSMRDIRVGEEDKGGYIQTDYWIDLDHGSIGSVLLRKMVLKEGYSWK